jgi:hypothetical protein
MDCCEDIRGLASHSFSQNRGVPSKTSTVDPIPCVTVLSNPSAYERLQFCELSNEDFKDSSRSAGQDGDGRDDESR